MRVNKKRTKIVSLKIVPQLTNKNNALSNTKNFNNYTTDNIVKKNKTKILIKTNPNQQTDNKTITKITTNKNPCTITNKNQSTNNAPNSAKQDETKSSSKNNKRNNNFVIKANSNNKTTINTINPKGAEGNSTSQNRKHILHGKQNNNSSSKFILSPSKGKRSCCDLFVFKYSSQNREL